MLGRVQRLPMRSLSPTPSSASTSSAASTVTTSSSTAAASPSMMPTTSFTPVTMTMSTMSSSPYITPVVVTVSTSKEAVRVPMPMPMPVSIISSRKEIITPEAWPPLETQLCTGESEQECPLHPVVVLLHTIAQGWCGARPWEKEQHSSAQAQWELKQELNRVGFNWDQHAGDLMKTWVM